MKDNPDSDAIAALHALWVGLCVQVEMREMKTNQAQRIFENFKMGIIQMMEQQSEATDKPET